SREFSTSIFLRSRTGSASLDWRQNRLTCRLGKLGRKRGARFARRARKWREILPEQLRFRSRLNAPSGTGLALIVKVPYSLWGLSVLAIFAIPALFRWRGRKVSYAVSHG